MLWLINRIWETRPQSFTPSQDAKTARRDRGWVGFLVILLGAVLLILGAERLVKLVQAPTAEPGVVQGIHCAPGSDPFCRGRFYPDSGATSLEVHLAGRPDDGVHGTLVAGPVTDTFYSDDANLWALAIRPGLASLLGTALIIGTVIYWRRGGGVAGDD